MKIFWLIWVLTFILFLFKPLEYGIFEAIIYLALFTLLGFLAYSFDSNKKSLQKIMNIAERINLTPLEEFVKKIEKSQKKYTSSLSKLEKELEERKLEQEKKYRDVVRKVLEIDNKLNTKFKLLGETVLKLSKEREED